MRTPVVLLLLIAPFAAEPIAAESLEASRRGTVHITEIATGLVHLWGLAFLPDGSMLVTERPGRLRRIATDGGISAPIAGIPAVHAEGQGGLLDVAVSPDFGSDSLVYFSYAEPGRGGPGTAVRRGRLDGDALRDVELLFRQKHRFAASHHYGSRLVFDRSQHLYITLGDRGERALAQRLDRHNGKIVRVMRDGSVPADNPFVGRKGALAEIWSYGHRNVQGATLHPDSGELWTHEHGPMGGDEVNIVRAGANHGWPLTTHGINYDGQPIPEAQGATRDGIVAPTHVWERSPGISGMAFCSHEACGAWHGNLFIGALAQGALIRLELEGDRVVAEERLLEGLRERIRDVNQGPDGALYLLTDAQRGRVLRVALQSDSAAAAAEASR